MALPAIRNRAAVSEPGLNATEVAAAIKLKRGNLTKAARYLRVDDQLLRNYVMNSVYLTAVLANQRQRDLDQGEEVLRNQLYGDDPEKALSAAKFLLDRAGVSRGFGNQSKSNGQFVINSQGPVVFQWSDGETVGVLKDAEGIIEG